MNKQDVLHYAQNMGDRLKGTPDFDYEVHEDPSNSGIIKISSKNYPATAAKYDIKRNKVTTTSGSRIDGNGALNECVNNDVLLKNATYLIDKCIFVKTDSQGRPWRWRVFFNHTHKPVMHGPRPKRELIGAEDCDQAGHVLAVSLGGGHERINVVPMPREINERWYRFQEVYLVSSLQAMNDEDEWYMELHTEIDYRSSSLRPEAIRLQCDLDNGRGYSAALETECVY